MTLANPHVPYAIDGLLPNIQIFDFVLPTYYPIISLTCCVCLIWLVKRGRQKEFDARTVIDSALVLMFSGFIGARLMHVVLEDLDYYRQNPSDILKFWNGGFVYYGGALFAFFCTVIFLKRHKERIGDWLNLYAPVMALGYALGRVACFVTGCCFGEVCELVPSYPFRHPTQLYAVVIELLTVVVLLKIERRPLFINKKLAQIPGFLFCIWIFLHALGRIFMEFLRADPRGPMPFSLSISTWVSLLLLISTSAYLSSEFKRIKT